MPTKSNKIEPIFSNRKDIIIRHCIIVVMALLFGLDSQSRHHYAWFDEEWFRFFTATFILIAAIWNGNLFFVDLLDKKFPWQNHIQKKIIYHLAIAIGWPLGIHTAFNAWVFPLITNKPCTLSSEENVKSLFFTVAVTLFINAVITAIAFFKFWRQSVKETEALKRESITAEFETLKNQINPHFLFNALNTLTNLIEEQPKQATEFVLKLAEVYRYVLTQKDKPLVSLNEELEFIQSYIYLNKIRFGNNLQCQINVPTTHLSHKIVSLSLQMLIENCIKHNVISTQNPLQISITVVQNKLVVKNNLQPKLVNTNSNGIGLNNIVHRYSFYTDSEVNIINDENDFRVELPLIIE